MKMRVWFLRLAACVLFTTLPAASVAVAASAKVPVQTVTLDNGLTLLLVPKPELTTVAGGWVAHVGSANERPGITGISHFFEHMMFKGTPTIGTKDPKRDAEIIAEQEKLQDRIRQLNTQQRERWRLGEIADPYDPATRPPELTELSNKFDALVKEQRDLMVKDEFDQVYTNGGGSGMNAFTNNDMTVYFITVPANKLELWFWMESDRLMNSVFREFYSERDVVYEERRLRTESTPTGKFDEQLDSIFWQSHPYNWPVIGWPDDLRSYTLQQAKDYYATYYQPGNLTVALVGNFDIENAKTLAKKYLGRLPKGTNSVPDVVTTEMPQLAEKRMSAECDCQPQIEVRYHTVPFMHKDTYPLEVLAGVLNGQTGRLNKELVLKQQIASNAGAGQNSMKWAGAFSFSAQTKGEADPEALEQAWYRELERIQKEGVPPQELEKVKNNIAADAYRRLQQPFFLLIQLLVYDGLKTWTYLNEYADKTAAVTADDVKRVANQYFTPENRTVGVYTRKAGASAEPVPPELADLPAEMQQGLIAQTKRIKAETDVAKLKQGLELVGQQKSQAPPMFQKALAYMEKAITERLAALEGGAK
ncbi:MAG: pitrilysin family protein [Acidobacteriota bacterium]